MKGSLWLHFIDNVASEHSLIKGSSSIASGDVVIGMTWKRIQALDIWAYFDRVASKSNPVDGLSRKKREGPWQRVVQGRLPEELEHVIREQGHP